MSFRSHSGFIAAGCAVLLVAGCQSGPRISSQTAPQADLSQYRTYDFMEKLSTDSAGYTSITTQLMKDAVSRELEARGFKRAENPDVLVNFIAASKDKLEGDRDPRFGVSYGYWGWGRHGWAHPGWGIGVGLGDDIRSVREDTLTVDLVDRERNQLVWSGTAVYRPSKKDQNDASARIADAVDRMFDRYPGQTQVAAVQ